jgi:hypothetical protein
MNGFGEPRKPGRPRKVPKPLKEQIVVLPKRPEGYELFGQFHIDKSLIPNEASFVALALSGLELSEPLAEPQQARDELLTLYRWQWRDWIYGVMKRRWGVDCWPDEELFKPNDETRAGKTPIIEFWFRTLKLCQALGDVVGFDPNESTPQWACNGSRWFAQICIEQQQKGIKERWLEPLPPWGDKAKALKEHRRRLKALRDYDENPLIDRELHRDFPALSMAYEAALKSVDQSDCVEGSFLEAEWQPYLKAYAEFLRDLDSPNWNSLCMRDGKAIVQEGKFRQTSPLMR